MDIDGYGMDDEDWFGGQTGTLDDQQLDLFEFDDILSNKSQ